jgi:hypothetical protein
VSRSIRSAAVRRRIRELLRTAAGTRSYCVAVSSVTPRVGVTPRRLRGVTRGGGPGPPRPLSPRSRSLHRSARTPVGS